MKFAPAPVIRPTRKYGQIFLTHFGDRINDVPL